MKGTGKKRRREKETREGKKRRGKKRRREEEEKGRRRREEEEKERLRRPRREEEERRHGREEAEGGKGKEGKEEEEKESRELTEDHREKVREQTNLLDEPGVPRKQSVTAQNLLRDLPGGASESTETTRKLEKLGDVASGRSRARAAIPFWGRPRVRVGMSRRNPQVFPWTSWTSGPSTALLLVPIPTRSTPVPPLLLFKLFPTSSTLGKHGKVLCQLTYSGNSKSMAIVTP